MRTKRFARIFLVLASLILSGCKDKGGDVCGECRFVDEVAATCTSSGMKAHYECDGCEKYYDEHHHEVDESTLVIPVHGSMDYYEGRNPTCDEDGYYAHYHCPVCDKYFLDEEAQHEVSFSDIAIPATGHELVHHDAKTATCEDFGYRDYYECTVCHRYFADANGERELDYFGDILIPATGHHLIFHEAQAEDCEHDGCIAHYECEDCHTCYLDKYGFEEVDPDDVIIPAHHELEFHAAQGETCLEAGNLAYYQCSVCGEYFLDEEGETEVSWDEIVIQPHAHSMVHHDAAVPSLAEEGNLEYYRCEECHHFFLDAEGQQEVEEADVILPKKSSHLTFEDDYYQAFVSTDASNTMAVSSEVAHSGSQSLKITASSARPFLILSDEYYDAMPEEGISFYLYCGAQFNAGTHDGKPPVYNAGKTPVDYLNYWNPVNEWKQYVVAKSEINPTAGNHYIAKPFVNLTLYIDDIHFFTTDIGFENAVDIFDVYSESRNTFEISSEQAKYGRNSLKVVTTGDYRQALNLSDAFYEALPAEGITFWMYASQVFNGNVAHQGSASSANVCHYYAPFNEWKQYTVSKDQLDETAGRHYVFLPYSFGDSLTVYIDGIKAAQPIDLLQGIDFENHQEIVHVYSDSRNEYAVSNEYAYRGEYSLKIHNTAAHNRGLVVSNELYASIPEEGGLTFYLNSPEQTLYGNIYENSFDHIIYDDIHAGWVPFTVTKRDINPTAGDHWIFTPTTELTFYVDYVRIVESV